jgi:hypothetical protein
MNPRTTISPERHLIARSAIGTAVFMVSLCAGKRPEEVAAEVAARAIAALRSKASNPSRP